MPRFEIRPSIVVLAVIIVLLLSAAATSFFSVDQAENAVVLRFGKYQRTVGPGLQMKIPFGTKIY